MADYAIARPATEEKIGQYEDGDWLCVCFNESALWGFHPQDADGKPIADAEGPFYKCGKCGRVYEANGMAVKDWQPKPGELVEYLEEGSGLYFGAKLESQRPDGLWIAQDDEGGAFVLDRKDGQFVLA